MMENEVKNVIEVKNLHKSYKDKVVLDDISFNLKKGEILSIIGKNGIGKSTTIDCIVGLKQKDSGKIKINDFDLDEDYLLAKTQFGYVPSEPTLYECMTGQEYVNFIASCYDVSQKDYNSNYTLLVKYFDLSKFDMNKRIANYSHGMKQKIGLIASLIHDPDIWILDEPTVGLDIMTYTQLAKLIVDLKEKGRSIFIASHNIDLVSEISDRVLILNNTKISKELDLNASSYLRKDLQNIFVNTYEDRK